MATELNEQELALFSSFETTDVADLEDLPSFDPYPNGAHLVTIEFEKKVINSNPAIILKTAMVETQQLEAETATPPQAGDTYDFMFGISSEYGEGSLKNILAPLAEATGITNNGALLDHVKGMQALIATKQRYDKKNDVMRCSITSIQLV